MRRGLALAAVTVTAALVIANACSLVTSYDGFGGATVCGGRIPAKPSAPSGGNETLSYVGALSFIDFIGTDGGKPYGWDLDGLCTCPEKAACRAPRLAPGKPCDVPSGTAIDNQAGFLLGQLFQGVQQSAPLNYGMGLRLTRYNGGADDSEVEVELYNVVHASAANGGPPVGDGNDLIVVDGTTVAVDATLGSGYVSSEAYVVGHRLVASFDAFKLRLQTPSPSGGTATVDAPLTAPYVIATIDVTPAGGLRSTDAQLVGRMKVADLFEAVSHYGICQNAGAAFDQTRDKICSNVDLPSSPNDDGKDTVCDAVSIAIGMRIAACKLAPEAGTPQMLTSPCGTEPPVSCN